MAAQFIYKGKDPKKSLPRLPPETPKNWQFLLSHNHWSNQPIKLLQLDALDAYHLEYCTKVLGQTAEQAKTTPMVVLWDCWCVNRSAATLAYAKEHYPYMRIRFIPAGGTGEMQLNDTHLHFPLKSSLRNQIHAWLAAELEKINAQLETGAIDAAAASILISQLSGIGRLRNLSVIMMQKALKQLTVVKPGDKVNLITKGWESNFGKMFDKEYRASIEARQKDLTGAGM